MNTGRTVTAKDIIDELSELDELAADREDIDNNGNPNFAMKVRQAIGPAIEYLQKVRAER